MALIDVSELLLDPDFVDEITIFRRVQSLNEYGEGVYTETKIKTVAVIQWGGVQYNKFERGTHFDRDITIYCKTQLYSMNDEGYCDEIEFQGRRYMVQRVTETAGNCGAGFCTAEATLVD